ncbi:MAG: putative metal-binding motif-containing protein [Deltaproteobacteria bacterium]|nr:putative metal-binding motif-containing protein [Deltaproteobacteria bacterium]
MVVAKVRYRAQSPFDLTKNAEGLDVLVALAASTVEIDWCCDSVRYKSYDRDLFFMIIISDSYKRKLRISILTFTAYNRPTERCFAGVCSAALRLEPIPSRSVLLLSVLIMTGCTLIDLGGIELPVCDPDECDELNRKEKSGCKIWQCPAGGGVRCVPQIRDDDKDGYYHEVCEGQVDGSIDCYGDDDNTINPGATEICDGKDNDCDGVIDEDRVSPADTGSQSIELPADDGPFDRDETYKLSVARGQPSQLVGVVFGQKGWLIKPDSPREEVFALDYFYTGDPDDDQTNCPSACNNQEMGCNFLQLAFDNVSTNEIITASVTGIDCPFGQLRIGFADVNRRLVQLEGGHSDESGVAFGVEAPRCGQKCNRDGVHHPVIAATSANQQRQALVVWLQEPVDAIRKEECSPQPDLVFIKALGLSIGEPRADAPPELKATNGGIPQRLQRSTASQNPLSLVAWTTPDLNSGYVLGYTDNQKHVRFAVFPAFTKSDDGKTSLDWFDYRPDIADSVEHVAIALGAPDQADPKRLSLLAAFRKSCGTPQKIGLALFSIKTAEYSKGNALTQNATDDLSILSSGGAIIEGPVVAYSDAGFFMPRGSTGNESIGGWTIVWTERRNGRDFLLASRVSEVNHSIRILNEPPTELVRGNGKLSSPVTFFDGDKHLYFAVMDHWDSQPTYGRTYCSIRNNGELRDETDYFKPLFGIQR